MNPAAYLPHLEGHMPDDVGVASLTAAKCGLSEIVYWLDLTTEITYKSDLLSAYPSNHTAT